MAVKKDPSERYFRQLEVTTVSVEGDKYELSISSEDPVKRWFGDEILSHSTDAVDLSVLNDVGTFLYTHGKDPKIGRIPIGKIEKAWLDEAQRKVRAIVSFDENDENAMLLKSKLDAGMLKGVSIGYGVNKWIELAKDQRTLDGRFVGPADIAVKWKPYEISLEPTPADTTVGFGKSIDNENNDLQQEERKMSVKSEKTEGNVQTQATQQVVQPTATRSEAEIAEAGRQAERTRCTEVQNLCRGFDIDPAPYIESGESLDNVRASVLKTISEKRSAIPAGSVQVTRDEGDKYRSAVVGGLMLRAGLTIDKQVEGARDFQNMSFRDIAIDCLSRAGERGVQRLSNDELFKRSVTPDGAFLAIANSVTNMSMATAYNVADTTYQMWTGKGTAKDFKPTKIIQISEAGDLREVKQNGEFTRDEMNDQHMATRQLITYGRTFGFTRQAFINDELDILTKVPAAYARAARRGINTAVYKLLRDNPIMSDANQLFSSKHKNIGIAGKPSTETYGNAKMLMRKQTSLRGLEPLNITPKFLLSPSSLEVDNQKMLVSLADPSASNSGVSNIFQNSMQLIVDPALDVDTGINSYYFVANPLVCDTIEVAYLNGIDMPTIETKIGFDYLGIEYRIFIDYAVTLVDHRGLVKTSEQ